MPFVYLILILLAIGLVAEFWYIAIPLFILLAIIFWKIRQKNQEDGNTLVTDDITSMPDFSIDDMYGAENQTIDDYSVDSVDETENLDIEEDTVDTEDYEFKKVKVVGVTYTNAKQMLRNVVVDNGESWNTNTVNKHKINLYLVPEPDNEYDPNAIKVVSKYETPDRARVNRSGDVGYLPKKLLII